MKRIKIQEVSPESKAADAGFHAGDILLAIDGMIIESKEKFREILSIGSSSRGSDMVNSTSSDQSISNCLILSDDQRVKMISAPFSLREIKCVLTKVEIDLSKICRVSTTNEIPGFKITESLDVVTAECAYGMSIIESFKVANDSGRNDATQQILRQARQFVLDEMRIEALQIGGNAVIGVDLDYMEMSSKRQEQLFIVASGTAVTIEPQGRD